MIKRILEATRSLIKRRDREKSYADIRETLTWRTKDGCIVPVPEMTDSHVLNAYRCMQRCVAWDGDSQHPGAYTEKEAIAELTSLLRVGAALRTLRMEIEYRGLSMPGARKETDEQERLETR